MHSDRNGFFISPDWIKMHREDVPTVVSTEGFFQLELVVKGSFSCYVIDPAAECISIHNIYVLYLYS